MSIIIGGVAMVICNAYSGLLHCPNTTQWMDITEYILTLTYIPGEWQLKVFHHLLYGQSFFQKQSKPPFIFIICKYNNAIFKYADHTGGIDDAHIIFEATRGMGLAGDIAIDDIQLEDGVCQEDRK